MNFYVPKYGNVIIDAKMGDGFRNYALPNLCYRNALVIAHKAYLDIYYKDKNAITIHKLTRLVDNNEIPDVDTIYIDDRIPRKESKAFKALKKLCKGKRIVIIEPPYDMSSLACIMSLLSVTKNPELKIAKFDRFMFFRPNYRR